MRDSLQLSLTRTEREIHKKSDKETSQNSKQRPPCTEMKDLAFVIVLLLSLLLLIFLTLLQAASRSLKVALLLSLLMGLVCSFVVAMIAYTVDDTLPADAMYKIMFISQLGAGLVSVMLSL